MKKSMWGLVGVALAASVVAASAQEVLSANTIGYIKRELPAQGKLITVAVPLYNMTAAQNAFSNLSIATEAPVGSTATFWDSTQQKWVGGPRGTKGRDVSVISQIVDAGEFFFIKGPAASTEPTEITIAGEVPADASMVRTFTGNSNLTAMANLYPADFVFTNSSLATRATVGSSAFFWDVDGQKWVGGPKGTKGWDTAVITQRVMATSGFFFKEVGAIASWTNAKPYTWP